MKYIIKFWETEDHREIGISDLYLEIFNDLDLAIIKAKEMVDDIDIACVEVVEARGVDTDKEIVKYGYDGFKTWRNNKGAKE
jgi:hypothetical protein